MTVRVVDTKCDLESEFVVYDFDYVEALGDRFLTEHQRSRTAGEDAPPFLRLETSDDWLNVRDTLFMAKIQHNDVLVFQNPSFEIRIREPQPGVDEKDQVVQTLLVSDDLTVGDVKGLYSENAPAGMSDDDKFLFQGRELDDNVMIYKFNIRVGAELVVEREDTTQTSTWFQCGSCGREFKLRKLDAVQCRSCPHGFILYKCRSKQISSYLAR